MDQSTTFQLISRHKMKKEDFLTIRFKIEAIHDTIFNSSPKIFPKFFAN